MRIIDKFKKNLRKRRTKDFIFYCILLSWPLLQFSVLYISVNINSVLLAFKQYQGNELDKWVAFDNFKLLFERFELFPEYGTAFTNSIKVFVIGTGIGISFAIFFSYYIYKKALFKNFFKIMLFLPSIIPAIAMVVMYKNIVELGIPTFANEVLGLKMKGLLDNIDTTLGTIIFYNIWVSFGVSILLYVGAMEKIPESCVEAAHLDGAGYFKELWFITIPLIWDTLSTFIIVSIGGLFINQANIVAFYQMSAEPYVRTIGYTFYVQTVRASGNAEYPVLAAMGLLMSAVTIPLVFAIRALLNRIGPNREKKEVAYVR